MTKNYWVSEHFPASLWPDRLSAFKDSGDVDLGAAAGLQARMVAAAQAAAAYRDAALEDRLSTRVAALKRARESAVKRFAPLLRDADAWRGRALARIAAIEQKARGEIEAAAKSSPFAGEVRGQLATFTPAKREMAVSRWIESGDSESAAIVLGSPASLAELPDGAREQLTAAWREKFHAGATAAARDLELAVGVIEQAGSALAALPRKLVGDADAEIDRAIEHEKRLAALEG